MDRSFFEYRSLVGNSHSLMSPHRRNRTIRTSPLKSQFDSSSCISVITVSSEPPPVPAPISGNAMERKLCSFARVNAADRIANRSFRGTLPQADPGHMDDCLKGKTSRAGQHSATEWNGSLQCQLAKRPVPGTIFDGF